jgi:cytochrome c oxidase cbb3-type subunit 3
VNLLSTAVFLFCIFVITAAVADSLDVTDPGGALFLEHCSSCHGIDGRGGIGVPDLADGIWQYGGSRAAIEQSIANGRMGVMPGLGMALGDSGIDGVVAYVLNLSDGSQPDSAAGRERFFTFCSACHGRDGTGTAALGAPDLTDDIWSHGSSAEAIRDVIVSGRAAEMPAFKEILSQDEISALTGILLSNN